MVKSISLLRAFCKREASVELFDYQVQFLEDCIHKKRVVGIFGRQQGKTTIMALFPIWKALMSNNITILVIAPTDRQAGELFNRLRSYAEDSEFTSQFIKSATLREMEFVNGSVIRAMPTGDFGNNIRGQTADVIILEESSYIKTEIVNKVIMPMIGAKGDRGQIIQIGTPFYKNHFYEASLSDKYAVHQYDYTHCPLISKEFIEEQRNNLTQIEFAMEHEARFIEDTDSYFKSEHIERAAKDYEFDDPPHPKSRFYLGVDFARMGQDKSVFIVIEKRWDRDGYTVQHIESTEKRLLTDAIGRVLLLDQKYNFERIYLDETGMGAGPTDILKEKLYAKIEPITFTMQSKQDIFSNLKMLLERGDLTIPNHKTLIYEMRDLRYEISSSGNLKIHHSQRGHDDFVDALALAVYFFRPKKKYRPSIA